MKGVGSIECLNFTLKNVKTKKYINKKGSEICVDLFLLGYEDLTPIFCVRGDKGYPMKMKGRSKKMTGQQVLCF